MPTLARGESARIEDPALAELRDAYRERNLVIFAGPGVSAAAGLPSWRRLVELTLAYARARGAEATTLAEIEELAGERRFIEALTAAKQAISDADFGALIEKQLDDRGKAVPEVGKAIAALSPELRAVLTTNLDHLLERALGGEWPMLARGTSDVARRRGFILKLHGTLLDRSTWVLTRDAYDSAMYADPKLGDAFASLFRTCPMLFVGYGLGDDDFDHLLDRVRALSGAQPPRSFALVAADSVKPYRRKELEEAGVRLIVCDERDEGLLSTAKVLRSLGEVAAARGPSAPAATPSAPAATPSAPAATPSVPAATPSAPSLPEPSKKAARAPQPPGASYNRSWYVHREDEESRALSYLESAGAPVVLWGPELFGKTTMLRYLLERVQEQDVAEGKQSLLIELELGSLLPSPPTLEGLLENMARSAAQQVPDGDEEWVTALAAGRDPWPMKLRKLFQKHLLPAAKDRLFLVIEGADAVWGLPFQGELYGMLRNWCELGHKEPWSRLRVLMALSTTPSLVLDGPEGSHSPWNLVPPIELSELGLEQIEALCQLYELDWPREAIERTIRPLVGGHPHHLRTLMYRASLRRVPLDALLAAASLEGLFSQHFAKLVKRLESEPGLEEAMLRILADPGVDLDETTFQRLLGAGLVTRVEGVGYRVRYSLDEGHLRKRWSSKRPP